MNENLVRQAENLMLQIGVILRKSGVKVVEVLRERRFKVGYVVRDEVWEHEMADKTHRQEMKGMAYTFAGDWIGHSRLAHRLMAVYGIAPEKSDPGMCVCTIGFCEKESKWYGWSHRAICGFGIGDRIFEEEYEPQGDKTPYARHGRKSIKNMIQAERAARRFAGYVSYARPTGHSVGGGERCR